MSDSEVVAEVVEVMTAKSVEKNWAQAVSIGDLFMLLLKLTVASVPFLVSASLAFFAGATGTYR